MQDDYFRKRLANFQVDPRFDMLPVFLEEATRDQKLSQQNRDFFNSLLATEQLQALSLYILPLLKRLDTYQADKEPNWQIVLDDFLSANSKHRVLLLQGNSGMGKSLNLLAVQEHQRLKDFKLKLQGYGNLKLIELKSHTKTTAQSCVSNLLGKPSDEKILVLLDGYDEISGGNAGNLYEANQLSLWPNLKLIISCRTQFLSSDYQRGFYPVGNPQAFCEYQLLPFNQTQIDIYIKQYAEQHHNRFKLSEYQQRLQTMPQLQEFITTPLLLRIAVEALPALPVSENLLRRDLYAAFMRQWFTRQSMRLYTNSALNRLNNPTEAFQDFSEKLAFKMFTEQRVDITYRENNADDVIWSQFFNEQQPEVREARQGCPLVKKGLRYSFIHKSFMEYFAAEHIYRHLQLDKSDIEFEKNVTSIASGPIGQDLLNREPAIIQFLAERVKNNTDHQARLFRLLTYSRKAESKPMLISDVPEWDKPQLKAIQNKIKVAAANAFTILNWAGVVFSQGNELHYGNQTIDVSDLRGVRIPGADGSQLMAHGAQFTHANLQRVSLQQSFLRDAGISEAKVHGVAFGERAYWNLNSKPNCMAFRPNGQLLAVGLDDHTIVLYSWPDGRPIQPLRGRTDKVTCLAWQGDLLASGSQDSTIRLWQPDDNGRYQPRDTLQGHTHWVTCLAWQGDLLASGSGDNTIRLWQRDVNGRYQPRDTLQGHTRGVTSLAWQGDLLASGSGDNTIRLWQRDASGRYQPCDTLQGHTNSVRCLAWQGDLLASGSEDRTIRLWRHDVNGCYQLRETLQGHTTWVTCLTWQGDLLASGSDDGTIRLWRRDDNGHYQTGETLPGHTQSVTCLAAWQGELLASGSYDKRLRLWLRNSNERYQARDALQGHTSLVSCLAWQGELLASGSWDNTIRLWLRDTNGRYQPRDILRGHQSWVTCLAWQDNLLASGSEDRTIRLWQHDVNGCYQLRETLQGHTNWVTCLAWQGDLLASGSGDNTIRLWWRDANGCYQSRETLQGHTNEVTCLAWQGDLLASGSGDDTIRLWLRDANGRYQPRDTLQGHTKWVTCLAWQGDLLASGSRDKTIRLWQRDASERYQLRYTLQGHQSFVKHLSFINDNYLLSWSNDGEMILWYIAQDSRAQELQRRQLLPLTAVAYQADKVMTGDAQGRLCYWRGVGPNTLAQNPPQLPNWTLQWSSGSALPLDVTGMNIAGARGLNKPNYDLLQQRGIKETPRIECRYCRTETKKELACTQCGEYFCPQHGKFSNPRHASELGYSRCHLHP